MRQPFIFGVPADDPYFIGREKYNLGSPSNITRLKQSMIDMELVDITSEGIVLGDLRCLKFG